SVLKRVLPSRSPPEGGNAARVAGEVVDEHSHVRERALVRADDVEHVVGEVDGPPDRALPYDASVVGRRRRLSGLSSGTVARRRCVLRWRTGGGCAAAACGRQEQRCERTR